MIFKLVSKSMLKKKGLLLVVFILTMLSMTLIGISQNVYPRLEANYSATLKDANPDDFRLYPLGSSPIDYDEEIKKVQKEENVTISKLTTKLVNSDSNKLPTYEVNGYTDENKLNEIKIVQGNLPENKNEIIVLPNYLKYAELKIGDKIKIADTNYKISGTAYFSDYIYSTSYFKILLSSDFSNFIPIYMEENSFNELSGDSVLKQVSYLGQFDEKDLSLAKRKEIVKDIRNNTTIQTPYLDQYGLPQIGDDGKILTRDIQIFPMAMEKSTQYQARRLQNEIDATRTLFDMMAKILLVITLILIVLITNNILKSQRRETGIIKAEGVPTAVLGFNFVLFIIVLLLISSIIGVLISFPIAMIMYSSYNTTYNIINVPISMSMLIAIIQNVTILIAIITVITYFLSIRSNLKEKTLNLIKNVGTSKLPKYNINKLFKHFRFIRKFQMMILFRNFTKTLLLIIGVLFSSFLLLLCTLMYTTMTTMMNQTYTETFNYKYSVTYNNGTNANKNSGITSSLTVKEIIKDDKKSEVEDNTTLSTTAYNVGENDFIHLKANNKDKIPKEGMTVTDSFKKKYNVKVGDKIVVVNPYKVDETKEIEISGFTDQFFMAAGYSDLEYFQKVFDLEDDYANITYYQNLTTNEKEDFQNNKDVQFTEVLDLQKALDENLGLMIAEIFVIALIGWTISFIIMFAISSIIISSNQKTISVMKVMGYTNKEIKKMTVGIYKWLVIVIYIALIPLVDFAIQKAANAALASSDIGLDVSVDFKAALFGLVVIYSVYLFSSSLTYKKIKNINLSESLKADE